MFSWSNEWFHIFGFKPITKGKHRKPKLLFEVFITIIFGICQLVINWLAQLLTWFIGLIQLIGTIWLIDSAEWHYLIDLYYWLIQLIGLGLFDWLVWLIDTIRLIDSTDWQYIWLIFLFNQSQTMTIHYAYSKITYFVLNPCGKLYSLVERE